MKSPNNAVPIRVLAIGAHPDDIEIGCAGALARCVQRGDKVTVAIACNGNAASTELPPAELVEVRSREARASADLIGAEFIELGLDDGGVHLNDVNRHLFADVIRRANPDVVITHFHSDYGGDHNNTFALALDATLNATLKCVATPHAPIRRIPYLYMMEPLGGFGFQPEVYVDITTTLEMKLKMIECHRSQIAWMSRYGGMDFRQYVDVMGRFRGYQAGVKFAEGFIPHKSWAHIPAGAILP